MYKITKKATKPIIKKLADNSVFTLSPEELCIYGAYRLLNLLDEYEVAYIDEVRYRICEIGPGRRRFDPLMLDIVLASKFFRENVDNQYMYHRENWFYSGGSSSEIKVKGIKEAIINDVYASSSSERLFEAIKKRMYGITTKNGYSVLDMEVDKNQKYVQLEIKRKGQALLLRVYNSIEWIYPDAWQIWRLAEDASEKKCVALLVAPRIHGSCFQLFKALGLLARTNYYFFTEKSMNKIRKGIIKSDMVDIDLSLGKIASPSEDAFANSFSNIEHLLTQTVSKYYDTSYTRFAEKFDRIQSLVTKKAKLLLNRPETGFTVIDRIKKIKTVLSMKIGHLNAIKDMVKRSEGLIKELECK